MGARSGGGGGGRSGGGSRAMGVSGKATNAQAKAAEIRKLGYHVVKTTSGRIQVSPKGTFSNGYKFENIHEAYAYFGSK